MQNKMLDMVLTSIVNNYDILDKLTSDIENRFKTKIDKQKLENYLSSVEVITKASTVCL